MVLGQQGSGLGATLRAEKPQMRYLVSEVCAEEEAVRTCGWCAQATCTLHMVLSRWASAGILYFKGQPGREGPGRRRTLKKSSSDIQNARKARSSLPTVRGLLF